MNVQFDAECKKEAISTIQPARKSFSPRRLLTPVKSSILSLFVILLKNGRRFASRMNVISFLAQRGNYRLFERPVNAAVATVFNAMQSHPKRIKRRFRESTPGALLAIILS
jgi:hypothetical protein